MGLKNNIIDLAIATKGDSYFNDGDKLVPERYVIKRHPGQYWGSENSPTLLTKTHRIIFDEKRLKEWTTTSNGIVWNANQVGLQLMNPKSESINNSVFNIPATRIYNPLKLFQNLTSPITMIRTARHGLNFFNTDTYEGIQKSLNDTGYTANRLYKLGVEFGRIEGPKQPNTLSTIANTITSISDAISGLLGNGEKIQTLSGIGGPNSVFGIGTTNFFKSNGGARTDANVLRDKNNKLISSKYNSNEADQYNIDKAKSSNLSNEEYIKSSVADFTNNSGGARTDFPNPKEINIFDSNKKKQYPDKTYSEMQSEFKNDHSTIYRILTDDKYSPGQGVPDAYKTGSASLGNSLGDILLAKNQKGLWIKNQPQNLLINKYEDITRIQNQSGNVKTFEKKLDFTGQSGEVYKSNYINNLSNTALEDVFVYKDKVEKLKTNSYNEVFQIEKRLNLSFNRNAEDNAVGEALDENTADQLLSPKYNAKTAITENGVTQYYIKKELPLSGNGGLKLHSKEFNLGLIDNTEDLIKFRFNWNRPDGTSGFLQLRGYLTGMTDNHKAEWEATRYIGRPDSVQKYDGYNRSFSFSFMVLAMSKAEKDVMWAKLSNLVNKVSPIVSTQGYMSSPFVYLTIGSYILDEPGYLDGLTYTIDDNYPWDIADERPMYINVSTTFIFLGKESPSSVKDYFPMRSF